MSAPERPEGEAPEDARLESRRDFLLGVKRWSKVVVGLVAAGAALQPGEAQAWVNGAWVNSRGGWVNGAAWSNRAGWINGAGGWVNRSAGGGAGWANGSGHGGSAGWVNRRGGWVNGAGWVNR